MILELMVVLYTLDSVVYYVHIVGTVCPTGHKAMLVPYTTISI